MAKKSLVTPPNWLPWTQPIPTMFIIQTNADTCWCRPNWTTPIINPRREQWYTHSWWRRNSQHLEMPSREKDPSQFELWNQCNSMILSWLSHSIEAEIVAGVFTRRPPIKFGKISTTSLDRRMRQLFFKFIRQ